jgi:BASS family bile acid:Na+ symporter
MDITALDELRIVLDPIGQGGIAIALMLVMFGIALGLRVADFTLLLEQRTLFFGGVVTQVVGLPLMTLGLVTLIAPPPSVALGMFVVACCPGGAASNLLTYIARGDVAYSVALTATSSLLAAILTPVSILFWSHAYEPTALLLQSIDVSAWAFLAQTIVLLGIPLFVGMVIAARAPDVARRVRRRITVAGSLALAGVIVYGTIYFFPVLFPALPLLGSIAIVHNAAAFLTGMLAGVVLRAGFRKRRALTFEVGIQNSGLAIVILLSQLKGLGGAAAIAAIWGVWHLVAGALIVVLYRGVDRLKA